MNRHRTMHLGQTTIIVLLGFLAVWVAFLSSTPAGLDSQSVAPDDQIHANTAWSNFTFLHITGANWSAAEGKEWCSGNGTLANPYVLENFTINAGTSPNGNGMYIQNSQSVYFIIRRCMIYNGLRGIVLNNVSLGNVTNNTCSANTNYGIQLQNNSTNNTLSINVCSSNGGTGIYLGTNCSSNTILNNDVRNNGNYGIYLYNNCNFNTVAWNNGSDTANTQDFGIYIYSSRNNTVRNNSINALENYGIYIYLSNGNNITGNTCNSSRYYNIVLSNADDNLITHNIAGRCVDHGISLQGSSDRNVVDSNDVHDNQNNGIELLSSCTNNTISRNLVFRNQDYGISVTSYCNGTRIVDNTIGNPTTTNQNYGIYLSTYCASTVIARNSISRHSVGGMYITLSRSLHAYNNSMTQNSMLGISITNSNNTALENNTFTKEGLFVDGSMQNFANFTALNDKVNGKAIYYYKSRYGLGTANFTNAGEIILVNCTAARVSSMDLSNASYGLIMYFTNHSIAENLVIRNGIAGVYSRYNSVNNTVSRITSTNNSYAVYVATQVSNMTIKGCAVSGGRSYGVYAIGLVGSIIRNNTIQGCTSQAIMLTGGSTANRIYNNTLSANYDGIYLNSVGNNSVERNFVSSTSYGGITLAGSAAKNNTVKNNTLTANRYGIYVVSSANTNFLFNNTVKTSTEYGIYIYSSANNNTVMNNVVIDNSISGIYIRWYSNNNVIKFNDIGNQVTTAQDYGVHFYEYPANNTIANNTLHDHTGAGVFLNTIGYKQLIANNTIIDDVRGIWIRSSNSSRFDGNRMLGTGIFIDGANINFTSLTISTNNTVNGKPVYCLVGQAGLTNSDVLNAGQVILANCNGANFSDMDVSNGTVGILLYASRNTRLTNMNADSSYYGFYFQYASENTTIVSCHASGSYAGIYSTSTNFVNVTGGIYSACTYTGIYISGTRFTRVNGITASTSGQYGILALTCRDSVFSNNICNNHTEYGIYFSQSNGNNTLFKNTCNSNQDGFYIYYSSNNTVANNTARYNSLYGMYLYYMCNRNNVSWNDASWNNNYGIYVYYTVSWNHLEGNRVFDNGFYGIILNDNAVNNTIIRNQVGNTAGTRQDYGISVLTTCTRNKILENVFLNNYVYAIYLNNADFTTASGNVVNQATSYGIYAISVDRSTISANTIKGMPTGIYLSACTMNNLVANTVNSTTTAALFFAANCDDNTIIDNTMGSNTGTGINVSAATSNNNSFYRNYIISCTRYGADAGIGNSWDNGSIGNFWGNYVGPDADLNAIGDTWYTVAANGVDHFPLLITNFTLLVDTDGDGLNGYQEILGVANPYSNQPTDPNDPDSDDDGILDGEEVFPGTDGQVTNPNSNDTDSDKMPDGWECSFGLNATSASNAMADPDSDGLVNVYEHGNMTNPLLNDTDSDAIPDGWEVMFNLDPLNTTDAALDFDTDGVLNIFEFLNGTNPRSNDTDFDLMPDGWEIDNSLNPVNSTDAASDLDLDGLVALNEFLNGTDPRDPDSDNDGILDGEEVVAGADGFVTLPLDADSDDDSFQDGTETGLGTSPLDRWSYPKPDLNVYSHSFDGNTMLVYIDNDGTWSAANVAVQLNITSTTMSYTNSSFVSFNIGAGLSTIITIDFTKTQPALHNGQNYTVSILIDPLNLVNETVETNNKLSGVSFVYSTGETGNEQPNGVPLEVFILVVVLLAGVVVLIAVISASSLKKTKKELAKFKPATGKKGSKALNRYMSPEEASAAGPAPVPSCFFHQGPITGTPYTCPQCKQTYCMACARALKSKAQKCWSCDHEIDIKQE